MDLKTCPRCGGAVFNDAHTPQDCRREAWLTDLFLPHLRANAEEINYPGDNIVLGEE